MYSGLSLLNRVVESTFFLLGLQVVGCTRIIIIADSEIHLWEIGPFVLTQQWPQPSIFPKGRNHFAIEFFSAVKYRVSTAKDWRHYHKSAAEIYSSPSANGTSPCQQDRILCFALRDNVLQKKKSSLLKWDSYRSISSASQNNRFKDEKTQKNASKFVIFTVTSHSFSTYEVIMT